MLLHRERELKSFKQEKEHIGMLIKMIKKITESVTGEAFIYSTHIAKTNMTYYIVPIYNLYIGNMWSY